MRAELDKYIISYLKLYLGKFNLEIISFSYNDGHFKAVMKSDKLKLTVENYHRELYFYVAPKDEEELEVNIYNILEFIAHASDQVVHANYYHEIKNLEECYKNQIIYLANVLERYNEQVSEFVHPLNFKENYKKLRGHLIKRYPNLYKGIPE